MLYLKLIWPFIYCFVNELFCECETLTLFELQETFGNWWTQKQLKAAELICAISDPKLREEILEIKDPKLADLIALEHRFDTASKHQNNNSSEDIRMNKAQPDYIQDV